MNFNLCPFSLVLFCCEVAAAQIPYVGLEGADVTAQLES